MSATTVTIDEVRAMYNGSHTFEAQYLPTFKKVLAALDSSNALDIILRYDDYKNIVDGINTTARQKHIRSLKDKLIAKGLLPDSPPPPPPPSQSTPVADDGTNNDSEEEGSDDEPVPEPECDFPDQLRRLARKAATLTAFYDIVVDHIHLLPPEVISRITRLGYRDVLGHPI